MLIMDSFEQTQLITRIAPTPSGFLHLGNAFNFLLTALIAHHFKGSLTLRIDDMDSTRLRIEYVDDIFACLEWLGIAWDKGPKDTSDFLAHYSQNAKKEIYRHALGQLKELTYPCACSRSTILHRYGDLVYRGHCRHQLTLENNREQSIRLAIDDQELFNQTGDIVLWRRDDLPAYQLVSVLEDEWAKTNFILRGSDLNQSSFIQRYLAKKLGLIHFPQAKIYHHLLVVDQDGQKLSKSQGASDLRSWRQAGHAEEMKKKLFLHFCHFFKLPSCSSLDELKRLDPMLFAPFRENSP